MILCVAACGGQTDRNGMTVTAAEIFTSDDADDATFDLGDRVADTPTLPDTLDVPTAPDARDTFDTTPPPDLTDLVDLPDMNAAADTDPPCVPDCAGKECGDDGCGGSCGVCAPPELTSFAFLASDNPSLHEDILLSFEGNTIHGSVPYSGEIENLVATFDHIGSAVLVGGVGQFSGMTSNDFGHVVQYSVLANDGQQVSYDVRVKYYTGLPIVYVNTNGVPINSKEDYVEGVAWIFGGLDFLDTPFSYMEIRGRGHSTWNGYPKKPYQIKLAEKTEVLGMPEEKRWILLASYPDKTMLRTRVGYEMGYLSTLDWTPLSHFAEVFINDQYNGTYYVSEKVEESDNRVAIGDDGFLLEIDAASHLKPDDVYFYSDSFLFRIEEPNLEAGSAEFEYIETFINEFEDVLMGEDFTDPVTGYPSYIDVDSFVDWYLINEISKEVDSKSYSSIYLSHIPGQEIKMGPLWDFDRSFGNVNYTTAEFTEGWWVKDNAWYSRLFQDPAFVALVKERFAYYMAHKDHIIDTIDFYAAYLDLAVQENQAKWADRAHHACFLPPGQVSEAGFGGVKVDG
jgi:hypothetical protein